MYRRDEQFMCLLECYFGVCFPRSKASRRMIKPKITHEQFATPGHTLAFHIAKDLLIAFTWADIPTQSEDVYTNFVPIEYGMCFVFDE